MALQGNHRSGLTIPDVFGIVDNQRLTGLLIVASKDNERCFSFRDGALEYALLNEPGQLLGELFMREFGLEQQILDRILANLKPGDYLGDALLDAGLASEEELHGLIARQVRRALRGVLRWQEWAFHFHSTPPDRKAPRILMSTQTMVMELAREIDEWSRVGEVLLDLNRIPERSATPVEDDTLTDWDPQLPPAGRILRELDGTRSLRTLLEESAHPVYPFACAIARLTDLGLILVRHPEQGDLLENPACPTALPLHPVMPDLGRRILSVLEAEPMDRDRLRELILSDPLLSARVLRLAALADREPGCGPLDFGDEIERLGMVSMKTMLLADCCRHTLLSDSGHTWMQHWKRAVLTSLAAVEVARETGFEDLEMAQLGGLLRDVGVLALIARSPEGYQQVLARAEQGNDDDRTSEQAIFGTDHPSAGAELADSWQFPAPLRSVIGEHYTASATTQENNPLLAIVAVAIDLASTEETSYKVPRHLKKLTRSWGLTAASLQDIHDRIRRHSLRLSAVGTPGLWPELSSLVGAS